MSERKTIDLNNYDLEDKVELILGNNHEIKIENGRTYIIHKNQNYPKTFIECCKVLDINPDDIKIDLPEPYKSLMIPLTKLLICRNAYWKLANNWEPKYNGCAYVITNNESNILYRYNSIYLFDHLLAFPTARMADKFLNYFGDNGDKLINSCKKFL